MYMPTCMYMQHDMYMRSLPHLRRPPLVILAMNATLVLADEHQRHIHRPGGRSSGRRVAEPGPNGGADGTGVTTGAPVTSRAGYMPTHMYMQISMYM